MISLHSYTLLFLPARYRMMRNKGTKLMIIPQPQLNPILVYHSGATPFINYPPIDRLLIWSLGGITES